MFRSTGYNMNEIFLKQSLLGCLRARTTGVQGSPSAIPRGILLVVLHTESPLFQIPCLSLPWFTPLFGREHRLRKDEGRWAGF